MMGFFALSHVMPQGGGDACAYQSLCWRGTETGEINEKDGGMVNQIGTDRVGGLALSL